LVAASLVDRFGSALGISTWQESQGTLFAAIRMEKVTVAILLLAVIAVAAFNIVSTLTMAVTEKAADIAVLRVMGMSRATLLSVFLGYGLVLGGIGIAIGTGLGVLLAFNISEIAIILEQLSGSRLFDPSVYYIGRLPSELQWLDVTLTVLVALALTLLATLYPALRAASIRPIEVLQDG
ncbi:MAG: FtsX-like permease family protein, partial [Halieaceae bacterium]